MHLPLLLRGGLADQGRKGKSGAAFRSDVLRFTQKAIDTLYPPQCLACPNQTATPAGLCGSCWREVHFLSGTVCDLCGITVPEARGAKGRVICETCTTFPPGWDQGRAAVAYEGVGRRIVLGLKHSDRMDFIKPLARWITGAGAEILTPDDVLIPVPLHRSRLAKRGFNQAVELARAVAARTGAEMMPDLVQRTRATPPQDGKRDTRIANVRDCFAIGDDPEKLAQIAGRPIVLIDDVMTTGATLATLTDVLRPLGPEKISTLVVARVARAR